MSENEVEYVDLMLRDNTTGWKQGGSILTTPR
jgi:hypothetical protein